jgi:hypothetical protein
MQCVLPPFGVHAAVGNRLALARYLSLFLTLSPLAVETLV